MQRYSQQIRLLVSGG